MPQPSTAHVPPQNIEAEKSVLGAMLVAEAPACPCGRGDASYSHRLGRLACARCYLGSISAAEREASDQAWARSRLATQVRHVAKRLPSRDPRAARLRDLALDLELVGSDRAAAPVIDELRGAGLSLAVRA